MDEDRLPAAIGYVSLNPVRARLARVPAKHALGLDPRVGSGSDKDMRQHENLPTSASLRLMANAAFVGIRVGK